MKSLLLLSQSFHLFLVSRVASETSLKKKTAENNVIKSLKSERKQEIKKKVEVRL